ncbi:MAG: prolipoprotein diacylglyceryl transferase [Bryobacterales bacterium]|nr:prolipoprotein diacylglyceryl transferase [Bryobacterales bacterium]
MLPKLISIGSFYLPTYGVLVALAFLAALWLVSRLARAAGLNSEAVVNLGVYCALAGIVGAKVLMIVLDPEFREHPMEVFSLSTLQSAGIFYGGLIAALFTAYFYMRKHGLPVLATADIFAPGVALGHAIGRLGCFAAGCCWGKPTHLPWAVTFTNPDARSVGVPLGVPLHPTQLYESFSEILICAVLYSLARRRHKPGSVIGLYLLLYGIVRFAVEFLREHDESNPLGGPLSLEQWISVFLALFGVWLVFGKSRLPEPAAAVNAR